MKISVHNRTLTKSFHFPFFFFICLTLRQNISTKGNTTVYTEPQHVNKLRRQRQCEALENHLSCHTCGYYFYTYLSQCFAEHILPYIAAVFPDGTGIFQKDIIPCRSAKKRFKEHWFMFRTKCLISLLPKPLNLWDLKDLSLTL